MTTGSVTERQHNLWKKAGIFENVLFQIFPKGYVQKGKVELLLIRCCTV